MPSSPRNVRRWPGPCVASRTGSRRCSARVKSSSVRSSCVTTYSLAAKSPSAASCPAAGRAILLWRRESNWSAISPSRSMTMGPRASAPCAPTPPRALYAAVPASSCSTARRLAVGSLGSLIAFLPSRALPANQLDTPLVRRSRSEPSSSSIWRHAQRTGYRTPFTSSSARSLSPLQSVPGGSGSCAWRIRPGSG